MLIRSNKIQQHAGFIYCKITLNISAVHRTHLQEYKKIATAGLWYRSQYLSNKLPPTWPNVAKLEEGWCCTRGCSYSFMYS
jgi:hypothetical protein